MNDSTSSIPYWRLSAFYFFYFALLGTLLPYWSLYLQHQSFDLIEIGQLMAILMGTKIIAPNLWGWLADRVRHRLSIVRTGALLTVICFTGVFFSPGFWELALIMVGFSFFWNAILPQYEVLTLNYLQQEPQRYSHVRVWGSIGFVVTSAGLGLMLDVVSIDWLPLILWMNMVLIWLSTFTIKNLEKSDSSGNEHSFLRQLRQPQVLLFFLICFLMQLSHGPYYTFYTIMLSDHGYTKMAIGWLWALGVIAEILVFLVMHRLMEKFTIKTLCVVSVLLATLRWVLIGAYPQVFWIVIFSQCLHAATFGVFHAVAIHMVHVYFPPSTAGQGQAFYSAVGFGAGGALGAYFSGFSWDYVGPAKTFYLAAASVGVATWLAWAFLRDPGRHNRQDEPLRTQATA